MGELGMKRLWLLFSQTVTVLVAVLFVVATLKPQWLDRQPTLASIVPVFDAPEGLGDATPGSLRVPARQAAAAPEGRAVLRRDEEAGELRNGGPASPRVVDWGRRGRRPSKRSADGDRALPQRFLKITCGAVSPLKGYWPVRAL